MAAFETVIRLQLDQYSPAEVQRRHVAIARAGLAGFLAGQSVKPDVLIETDGRPANSENEVMPFGVITYRFPRMREIVAFAIAQARAISPVDSGAYRNAWFPIVDGAEIDPRAISGVAPVTITNDQPYARKIHVGARGFEAYAGIVEKVRQIVLRQYGGVVSAEIVFLNLQGGWVLRKGLRKIHNGRRYGGVRNDAAAGMEITYPSLVLTPKLAGA